LEVTRDSKDWEPIDTHQKRSNDNQNAFKGKWLIKTGCWGDWKLLKVGFTGIDYYIRNKN